MRVHAVTSESLLVDNRPPDSAKLAKCALHKNMQSSTPCFEFVGSCLNSEKIASVSQGAEWRKMGHQQGLSLCSPPNPTLGYKRQL
jgi:hypothetical protein